ncbi:6234_t:CDS:2 [Funneliformis mosseae]|uniref:6234_t:CDS:1 n=1 Tax=Funneliformis mosseae TaxID=27381 RepID=A0A9N9G661_FUNMO|nr:6234_t:CDS:2 [Funneliformis mosseae]
MTLELLGFMLSSTDTNDFDSLMQIRVGGKQGDDSKIGKHGLGFNSCYHFTDVPSFISGDSIAFLDPHEKFLPRRHDSTQRGIIGPIPKNGIGGHSEKDQLVPYEGIEGIDFRSTFRGTLFRIPLRKQPSDISDSIFATDQILELFTSLKSTISSQFLFLRHIETIEISYILSTSTPLQINSLYKATITGLTENVRNKRKCVINNEIQTFQMEIEQFEEDSNNVQKDCWIIVTGAQPNPEDPQLKQYAERYRLRVLGGIAALYKSSKDDNNRIDYGEIYKAFRIDFIGRLYSFLSLPDTTYLQFHLNGTWAQGSNRGRLLLERDNSPDIDHQKLNWNRHIMLEFLPKLYCKLIKKAVEMQKRERSLGIESMDLRENIHPVSKFWPFPLTDQSNSNYVVEFGFKVLEYMIQNEDIFDGSIENRVNSLFEFLLDVQIEGLRYFLQIAWYGIEANPNFKSLVRFFPIWKVLLNPLDGNSEPVPLKPATCGFILENNIKQYQINTSKIYLDATDENDRFILTQLNVPMRTIFEYTFEDVEFPREYNSCYLEFLKDILNDYRIVRNLNDKCCFPNANTKRLKKITDLYDYNNLVFRTVFGGDSSVFLHPEFSEFKNILSTIGFKHMIDIEIFRRCAVKVKELLQMPEPPSDIRYRGFILVNHLYKNINAINLESIEEIPFYPITKSLGKPYNLHYNHTQSLDCLNNIILPAYREVAWSQMPLIAEDVIPPHQVLQRYPSFGKPDVSTVVRHLRFLYSILRSDEVWKKDWTDVFRNNIFDVYKWLDEECCSNEDLNLSEHICFEPLFLNCNRNQDPFNIENWVTSGDLVLNSELDEVKYVHPELARYPNMLKSAGAREIRQPNVRINVREHDQSHHNNSTLFKFLFDQTCSLHDVTFVVNGESIKASRYMLAASSEFFNQKFTSEELSPTNPVTITIENIEPNSMRIFLRYLYGQNIDNAIQNRQSLNINVDLRDEPNTDESQDLVLYKNLLKLADDYNLDHLKELMELRLSRLVFMSNVDEMKRFAEISNASQLNEYCYHFTPDNSGVRN